MKESDWKVFKEIKSKAIDKFCADALNEYREKMDVVGTSNHKKYLLNYKLVQDQNKEMSYLFDFQSRSKATMQLLAIRGKGLADEKLIEQLSDECRKNTDPKKYHE